MVAEVGYLSPRPLLILATALSSLAGISAEKVVSPPLNSSCACPSQNLTFQCTIVGDGATIWGGSAFSCAGSGNEIILRHNSFATGISKECNGGAIFGQSLVVQPQSDQYRSQLFVNVSTDLNTRTVSCTSSIGPAIVGEAVITVNTAPIDQVPNGIRLTNVEPEQLTFTWNAVNTNCPSINYLASSNCTTWSCVNPTNTTTAVCSGLQLPSVCTFTVQTEVCGQVGPPSDPITVRLRVPDMPMVKIIPVYSGAQQDLLRIKANITDEQDSFNITDTVSGSVTSYSISFNSANDVTFGRNTSCVEDICEYVINVPSDLCPSSNDISISLSASNRLGQGPFSDPTTIGCTNRFVEVEYDRMTSSITCRFLEESDTSIKSCSVTYGRCSQVLGQVGQLGNFSSMEAPNTVYIKLPVVADDLECYSVTASSDLFTVIVENKTSENRNGGVSVAVIVGIIIAILVVAVAVMSIILISVIVTRKRRGTNKIDGHEEHRLVATNKSEQVEDDKGSSHFQEEAGKGQYVQTKAEKACNTVKVKPFEDKANSVIDVDDLLLLHLLDHGSYKIIEVTTESELREFVEEQNLAFKRGYAFYEFLHDFESISEDKELIFMSEEDHGTTLYTTKFSPEHPICGFRIPKPKSEKSDHGATLFVQSTGSGVRHLPAGSKLLYKIEPQTLTSSRPGPSLLKPVLSSHFELTTLLSELTVKQFCEEKQIPKDYSVFLELGDCDKKYNYVDVILQDKKTGFLYTGPSALNMVKKHSGGEKHDLDKWKVLVLCHKLEENMVLKPGTTIILHQASGFNKISIDDFHVLTQGESEDYTCMSDFIKKKLSLTKFTNGHAFYEFIREEDLQYYKEVVHLLSEEDNMVVHSGIDLFYRLPGVPGVGVKPPNIKGMRVFIQSTSQGARCVKPGDTILYKKTI